MKFLFTLVGFWFASSSEAAVLKLDCQFSDPSIRDHLLIEFATDQRGTFFYQAEVDQLTAASLTDKLELKRVASDRTGQAKWRVDRNEVGLFFYLPAGLVDHPSETFDGELLTQIPELHVNQVQDLKCSSRF